MAGCPCGDGVAWRASPGQPGALRHTTLSTGRNQIDLSRNVFSLSLEEGKGIRLFGNGSRERRPTFREWCFGVAATFRERSPEGGLTDVSGTVPGGEGGIGWRTPGVPTLDGVT
jgi:hypothetical protein